MKIKNGNVEKSWKEIWKDWERCDDGGELWCIRHSSVEREYWRQDRSWHVTRNAS